jgi:DNA polymerase-3 subunit delta'
MLNISVPRLPLHPDYLCIERIDEEGELKKDITIDHIGQITKKIMRAPVMGKYHVVIIKEAEKMNISASNSLLKILEEPTTPTVFFLLTQNEEKLIGTIRSRIQCLRLERPRDEILRTALVQIPEAQNNPDFDAIIALSEGLPGIALSWFQNGEAFLEYKREVERFFSLFGKPFYEKLALVEDLYSDKKAHIEGRAELDRVLDIWLQGTKLLLENKGDVLKFFSTCPQSNTGTLVPFCDMILEAQELLSKNVHPRILIEHLLLCLS